MNTRPTLIDPQDELARRHLSFRVGYDPPVEPLIDPSISLYPESEEFMPGRDTGMDVFTYEIIRSKLWNLNLDHSDTVRRTSGSNIVVEGYDLTSAIATGIGEVVTFSPYTMFFAGTTDAVIKWTLEHRSMNVGIAEGDIFMQDDPWVGTNHQFDTAVYTPVFVEGMLFGWLYNCVHQREIGGRWPGGFDPEAIDCYTEPSFMPPVKLAENDRIREDILDLWTRRSRLPDVAELEVRSQLAGLRTARMRLDAIITRYGAPVVRAAMAKMIADSAETVGARLGQLPDATWKDERYISGAVRGDSRVHKLCLTFEKRGNRLSASNAGTDPSVGTLNTPRGMFRAAVMAGLLPVLAHDLYLCAGGLLRQLDFECEEGSINGASHPASVASSIGSVATTNQAQVLGAKMVSGCRDLAQHAFASSTIHTLTSTGMVWPGEYGSMNVDSFTDLLSGGIGAFNHRDGMAYGGSVLAVAHRFSDVERFEQAMPMLYLYRRELPWVGGHGKWRGGANYVSGYVGRLSQDAYVQAGGLPQSVTMGLGVCGGMPSTGGYFWWAPDTEVRDWFAQGSMPAGPEELRKLAPHGTFLVDRQNRLCDRDVFEYLANPGAGWGDPLERDPTRVAEDLAAGRVRLSEAVTIYGVDFLEDGRVDEEETANRRSRIRLERKQQGRAPRTPSGEERVEVAGAPKVTEGVAVAWVAGDPHFACARCGTVLSDARQPYRHGCIELDSSLTEISEAFLDPLTQIGEDIVLRSFACPGCSTIVDRTISRRADTPFSDVEISAEARGPDRL